MRVVITGGSGFIGQHLVRHLCEKHEVKVLDIKQNESLRSISEFERVDVRDLKALRKGIKDADVVIHLAALIDVRESVRNPSLYAAVNTFGTANVAQACVELSVRKLVFASSCAVYGEPSGDVLDEEMPTNPTNPYGASKLAAEVFLKSITENYTILRITNVYGIGGKGVIPLFVERAIKGKALLVNGTGEQTRDFIYVGDLIRCFELALTKGNGETINVGFGRTYSINDVIEILREVIPKKLTVKYLPKVSGEVEKFPRVRIDKMKKVLGFCPKTDLKSGIKMCYQEMVAHEGMLRGQ